jgi:hypothetical protein
MLCLKSEGWIYNFLALCNDLCILIKSKPTLFLGLKGSRVSQIVVKAQKKMFSIRDGVYIDKIFVLNACYTKF